MQPTEVVTGGTVRLPTISARVGRCPENPSCAHVTLGLGRAVDSLCPKVWANPRGRPACIGMHENGFTKARLAFISHTRPGLWPDSPLTAHGRSQVHLTHSDHATVCPEIGFVLLISAPKSAFGGAHFVHRRVAAGCPDGPLDTRRRTHHPDSRPSAA